MKKLLFLLSCFVSLTAHYILSFDFPVSDITTKSGYIEKPIVIIVCSYNNSEWYKKNLDSIFFQRYENFVLLYVDDCSSDNTGVLVENYVKERGLQDKCMVIKNTQRSFKMANLYKAFHMCPDNVIIVELDGDDWLSHENILSTINRTYQEKNAWLTYGHFLEWPQNISTESLPNVIITKIPQEIISANAFRAIKGCIWAGLRTYYAWLVKRIKLADLLYAGNWLTRTSDTAIMLPMFEMAGDRYAFIDEILLIHNCATPLNDHKVDREFQYKLELFIRKKKPYERLPNDFEHIYINQTSLEEFSRVILCSDEEQKNQISKFHDMCSICFNESKESVIHAIKQMSADYIVFEDSSALLTDQQIQEALSYLLQTHASLCMFEFDESKKLNNQKGYIKVNDAIGVVCFSEIDQSFLDKQTILPMIVRKSTILKMLEATKTLSLIDCIVDFKETLSEDIGIFFMRNKL